MKTAPAECCQFFIFHNGKNPNHLIILHAQGIRKYDLNRFFLQLKRILLTKFLFLNHVFKDTFRSYITYVIKEFLPQNLALKKNCNELKLCKCTLLSVMHLLIPRSHSGQCVLSLALCVLSWGSALWQTFSWCSLWGCPLFMCMQDVLHSLTHQLDLLTSCLSD